MEKFIQPHLSIDAKQLDAAQDYYKQHGYTDVLVPWLVGDEAYTATLPVGHEALKWQSPLGTYHVASAEQGFLQLMLENNDLPAKAQSTTPCFRGEPVYNAKHLPFFYKLELYNADTSQESLDAMITCARGLFTQMDIDTRVVETAERTYDIETARTRIELGSYGVRNYQGHEWLYGTGLALPRANQAKFAEHEARQ